MPSVVSVCCPSVLPPLTRSKYADQVRIAAKVANVVLDPLERKTLVLDAEVGDLAIAVGSGKISIPSCGTQPSSASGSGWAHCCFCAILEARGNQEAKGAQAIVDGHHDDVGLVGLEDALVQQVR